MSNKIAFLFGAGVSIPSGLPKTDELTDIILKGEYIENYTWLRLKEHI